MLLLLGFEFLFLDLDCRFSDSVSPESRHSLSLHAVYVSPMIEHSKRQFLNYRVVSVVIQTGNLKKIGRFHKALKASDQEEVNGKY